MSDGAMAGGMLSDGAGTLPGRDGRRGQSSDSWYRSLPSRVGKRELREIAYVVSVKNDTSTNGYPLTSRPRDYESNTCASQM